VEGGRRFLWFPIFLRVSPAPFSCIPLLESFAVFGDAPCDTFAPDPEAGGFELGSHVTDHVTFTEAGAITDFIEAGTVMPCHADEGVAVSEAEFFGLHCALNITALSRQRQVKREELKSETGKEERGVLFGSQMPAPCSQHRISLVNSRARTLSTSKNLIHARCFEKRPFPTLALCPVING